MRARHFALVATAALVGVAAGAPDQAPLDDPSTGWLLVSVPGDSSDTCGPLRVYDLATGVVLIDDGCRGRSTAGTADPAAVQAAARAVLSRRPGPWTVGRRPPTAVWRWLTGGETSPIGDLPWTATAHPDDRLARARLREADESTVVTGCVGERPPTPGALAAARPQMVQPVSAHEAQVLADRYRGAVERWTRLPPCR